MKQITIPAVLIGIWVSSVVQAAEFESEFISVKTQGAGPDVILLHGFASSPDVWSGVATKIDSPVRLHLLHFAGFAGSPAAKNVPRSYLETIRDEIARYIEVENLKQPVLIGHSMGGLLSLMVSSKEPSRVGRVIIVDALPFFSLLFNPLATAEQVLPQAKAMEKQMASLDNMQFEQQAKLSASILTKDGKKKDLLLKWSKESDRKAYAQIFREIMAYDARPELNKITCPVFVIYAYDKAMNVPEARIAQLYTNAYANVKGIRIQSVADSLHFIMWDQPEGFQKTLNEMLTYEGSREPTKPVAQADNYLKEAEQQWGAKNFDVAITKAKQALAIYKEEFGEEHPKVAEVQAMIDAAGKQE